MSSAAFARRLGRLQASYLRWPAREPDTRTVRGTRPACRSLGEGTSALIPPRRSGSVAHASEISDFTDANTSLPCNHSCAQPRT